jgi:hypothetical protein
MVPPRQIRFGSPLVMSRIPWVEPKHVAESTYLTWTTGNCYIKLSMWGCGRKRPSRCGTKGKSGRGSTSQAIDDTARQCSK